MTATDETTPTIADVHKLAGWLDGQGLGAGEPLEHRYISGGSQNEIYELRRGDLHCAMRIPPSSAPADRDNGILREWRIIEAPTCPTPRPSPSAPIRRCWDGPST